MQQKRLVNKMSLADQKKGEKKGMLNNVNQKLFSSIHIQKKTILRTIFSTLSWQLRFD